MSASGAKGGYMDSRKNVCVSSLWILLLFSTAILFRPAFGQEVSAGITGRVTDPAGAAVVGAAVSAKDVNRGTVWPTKTNEEGIYAFPRIPVGTYEVKVEAQGFKTAVRPGVTLELNQRARIDVALELGTLAESVQVSGEAPLLSTETTIVGTVMTSNSIVNAPRITRTFS